MLADMFKFLIDDLYKRRYTYVFFLRGQRIWEKNIDKITKDGTRYQSPEELNILDEHMSLVFTKMFKIDNIIDLDCPVEERCSKALEILLKKSD